MTKHMIPVLNNVLIQNQNHGDQTHHAAIHRTHESLRHKDFAKDNGLPWKDSRLFRHYTVIKGKAQPGNGKSLEKYTFLENATKKLPVKTASYGQKPQREEGPVS